MALAASFFSLAALLQYRRQNKKALKQCDLIHSIHGSFLPLAESARRLSSVDSSMESSGIDSSSHSLPFASNSHNENQTEDVAAEYESLSGSSLDHGETERTFFKYSFGVDSTPAVGVDRPRKRSFR